MHLSRSIDKMTCHKLGMHIYFVRVYRKPMPMTVPNKHTVANKLNKIEQNNNMNALYKLNNCQLRNQAIIILAIGGWACDDTIQVSSGLLASLRWG